MPKEFNSNNDWNPDDSYRATQEQKLAASNALLQDEQFLSNFLSPRITKPAKSMPSMFQALKTGLTGLSKQERSNAIDKLHNIYEDAETKKLGLETLEKLNLPRYKRVITTVNDFLEHPAQYFQILRSELYFPSVMDANTGVRHFELGLNQKKPLNFSRNY